jgi:hypothetical protein
MGGADAKRLMLEVAESYEKMARRAALRRAVPWQRKE